MGRGRRRLIFSQKGSTSTASETWTPRIKKSTTPLAGVSGSDEHTSASLDFFLLNHPLTFMCLNIIFDQESSILHLNLLLVMD